MTTKSKRKVREVKKYTPDGDGAIKLLADFSARYGIAVVVKDVWIWFDGKTFSITPFGPLTKKKKVTNK